MGRLCMAGSMKYKRPELFSSILSRKRGTLLIPLRGIGILKPKHFHILFQKILIKGFKTRGRFSRGTRPKYPLFLSLFLRQDRFAASRKIQNISFHILFKNNSILKMTGSLVS